MKNVVIIDHYVLLQIFQLFFRKNVHQSIVFQEDQPILFANCIDGGFIGDFQKIVEFHLIFKKLSESFRKIISDHVAHDFEENLIILLAYKVENDVGFELQQKQFLDYGHDLLDYQIIRVFLGFLVNFEYLLDILMLTY